MYRVALTYHPDVGTFRGKRGAWRVRDADPGEWSERVPVAWGQVLYMVAAREYRRGTWVNPLKILKEYQSTKRSNTQ